MNNWTWDCSGKNGGGKRCSSFHNLVHVTVYHFITLYWQYLPKDYFIFYHSISQAPTPQLRLSAVDLRHLLSLVLAAHSVRLLLIHLLMLTSILHQSTSCLFSFNCSIQYGVYMSVKFFNMAKTFHLSILFLSSVLFSFPASLKLL